MDNTYRSQFANNTMASMLAFSISAVIGFVMPWLIYEQIGQTFLGIWDLGWSLLLFLSLPGLGYGPALIYYLAKENGHVDKRDDSTWVLSAFFCQVAVAFTIAFVFKIGFEMIRYFGTEFTVAEASAISKLGTVLGLTLAIAMLGDIARSILIGVHESKTSEFISIAHDVFLAVSMLISLFSGGGIVWLAIVTLGCRTLFELIRFAAVLQNTDVFKSGLNRNVSNSIRRLSRYAAKSGVFVLQENMTLQVTRLILFVSAGPATLAVFSRYATLFRQLNLFIDRVGIALPAMVSRFQSKAEYDEIQRLYIGFAQLTMLLSLPLLVIFGVWGDTIVTLWMSEEFVVDELASIFAAGGFFYANYSAAAKILSGLNRHGKIALKSLFAASALLVVLGYVFYPFTSMEAALLVAITSIVALHTPFILYLANYFGIPWIKVVVRVNVKPILCNLVFLFILIWSNELFLLQSYVSFFLVLVAGCVSLLVSYWYFGIDQNLKDNFFAFLNLENKPASRT